MSRGTRHGRKHLPLDSGVPWMVWGLLIGWLAGAADEIVEGLSMFRMMVGGVAGLALGALADVVRGQIRKRAASNNAEQKRRGNLN